MIVLVWVQSVSNPSNKVLQFDILDDQSNVSFISQGLCNRLHLKGHPTKLSLTMVQESDVIVDSSKINDIEFPIDHFRISSSCFLQWQRTQFYSVSLVLLLIFKNTCEREQKIIPPTIHADVKSINVHWNLGIFNFIVRLTMYKLSPLLLWKAVTAMRKWSIANLKLSRNWCI